MALRPGGGGVQTYARELLRELSPLISESTNLSATVQIDAVDEIPIGVRAVTRPVASGARRAAWAMVPVAGSDLFHSLDVDLPIGQGGLKISTFHDMSVFDVPWAFSRYRAAGERRLLSAALRKADVVIAVSDFTAERIFALSGRHAVVTPLAPASWATIPTEAAVTEVRRRLKLPERFVLQVGTIEPRKDVALVAEACTELSIPFLLAGSGSTGPDAPRSARGLGYVATEDLPALYSAATAVAYSSHYEGFGLPPLEAMACGAAVVASAVGALTEFADNAAVLVRKHDKASWLAALRSVVLDDDVNTALRISAPRVAARSTWTRTAEYTVDAYRIAGLSV
ncbi:MULTISPECIES: glycosyltransferase family 4 protein [unclassified Rhodococcus (in: high G+C Gram-positive bacteria)]|uniref:glycosyltransferase family 4 protein n=1 Tax=unclassified Rhodococcus (in: high G+C Gram-positive bacteria) TaxID=192944 RepID=UPI00215C85EF|nr:MULTISPECIES: glycosyltransferase family 1 protein [unclassified Rhodococcus (in: high G+C Gram-positive bacteria)]